MGQTASDHSLHQHSTPQTSTASTWKNASNPICPAEDLYLIIEIFLLLFTAVGLLGLVRFFRFPCVLQLFSNVRYAADRSCKLLLYHTLVYKRLSASPAPSLPLAHRSLKTSISYRALGPGPPPRLTTALSAPTCCLSAPSPYFSPLKPCST
jgi:hypothetical protein